MSVPDGSPPETRPDPPGRATGTARATGRQGPRNAIVPDSYLPENTARILSLRQQFHRRMETNR